MSNMTLGAKITFGFGIILVIMLILGGIGVYNMNKGSDTSYGLAEKYGPEVELMSRLERNVMLMMYELRGYNFTGDEKYLTSGKDRLDRAKQRIEEAEKLVADHPDLVALKKGIAGIETPLLEYEKLISQTEEEINKQNKDIDRMDESAGRFVKNINQYLKDLTAATKELLRSGISPAEAIERADMATMANDIVDLGNEVRIENFKAQASGEYDLVRAVLSNFDEIDRLVDELNKLTTDQKALNELQETKNAMNDYEEAVKNILVVNAELSKINQGRVVTGDEARAGAEDIARVAVNEINEQSDEAYAQLNSASLTMIIGLISALIIAIVAAMVIIRSVTRPTIEAVRTIAEANSQVVAASDQISASSQSLAQGASEQASSVEEVSATVEESTAINNQNSENGREANALSKAANDAATMGNDKIQHLMTAMKKITEASEQIAKIIKTIDEIAFQTNLLALNAAVEAARAGEHGLGFAVVADEVKNLAQRSANAAKETADIIEGALEEIKNGNKIAQETNDSFTEILEKVKKTSDLIGEIATSVTEQAEGMNQVATAMGQIDQVTQQNAANSEQAAAAAEQLNAQALAMMQSVEGIGRMVGYDASVHMDSHQSSSSDRHIEHKPKKSEKQSQASHNKQIPHKKETPKKQNKDDDIFPLDEDDLKEF